MLVILLLSFWGVRSEECVCTGSNEGLPNSSPHQGTVFGESCQAWDSQYDICTNDNPPKWCSEKWCYVKKDCTIQGKVDSKKSTYEFSGLYYSYRVCGSIDYFDNEEFKYEWKGCGEKRTKPLDVYFAVDASGSINPTEWQQQMTFLSKLTEFGLDVEGDRAGVIQWSRLQSVAIPLGDPKEVIENANGIVQKKGSTKTAQALNYAVQRMEKENDGNKKVIIMLTDGTPDKGTNPCADTKWVDMKFKESLDDKEITFGILAIGNKDFSVLECLVDDSKKNIIVMKDFSTFYEYRDPTGDKTLICVDPNVFTEDEIVVDDSCGCRCKVRGKNSKKAAEAKRQHYAVQGGSCACKKLCRSENAQAFSYRINKVSDKRKDKKNAGKLVKNCVCFDNMDQSKIKASAGGKGGGGGNQLIGMVDMD